ncbi:MAG: hypothetical protein SGBAC_004670 [Bacillariaceae sp.]
MRNPALSIVSIVLLVFQACACVALTPNVCERSSTGSRRSFFIGGLGSISAAAAAAISVAPSFAAETVGKDEDCNDQFCIGVWDGLLADCPHGLSSGAGCTSSQDDTPGIFLEPWDYAEAPNNTLDWKVQMRLLVPTIQLVSARRGDDAQVLVQNERYLRVLFTDGKTGENSMGEFYFTPDDTTVQFRIDSLGSSAAGLLSRSFNNMERSELIRKELKYLKVPVLRNRRRSLFFVESNLDTFGPGSAALGPPAEMKNGEIEGRGSDDVDPKLKIDLLQQFPKSF